MGIKQIFEKLTLGNTIYFSGCLTKFAAPEIEENYITVIVFDTFFSFIVLGFIFFDPIAF